MELNSAAKARCATATAVESKPHQRGQAAHRADAQQPGIKLVGELFRVVGLGDGRRPTVVGGVSFMALRAYRLMSGAEDAHLVTAER